MLIISWITDLQAMLFTVLAFGWDAYLIPDTGECLIQVSYDGWLRGWATSPTGFDALKLMLYPWPLIQNPILTVLNKTDTSSE